jgi:hypothetical protein
MDPDSVLATAPRRLRVRGERAQTLYELATDLIAVHGAGPSPDAISLLEGGAVAVERLSGARSDALRRGALGPVYRRVPGGGVAVPTGQVFVRLAEGQRAEERRAELERSGYRIEEVPAYAPHAAWIRPASDEIADGLRNLDRLERLPAVARVEPQFLAEASRR